MIKAFTRQRRNSDPLPSIELERFAETLIDAGLSSSRFQGRRSMLAFIYIIYRVNYRDYRRIP